MSTTGKTWGGPPRRRMITPSLWRNRKWIRLDSDSQVLFLALISLADDAGRHWMDPLELKASVFPLRNDIDETRIRQILTRLSKQLNGQGEPLISVSETTIQIMRWEKHQDLSKFKPKPSEIPEITTVYENKADSDQNHTRDCPQVNTSEGNASKGEGEENPPVDNVRTCWLYYLEKFQSYRDPLMEMQNADLQSAKAIRNLIEVQHFPLENALKLVDNYATLVSQGIYQEVMAPSKFWSFEHKNFTQPPKATVAQETELPETTFLDMGD